MAIEQKQQSFICLAGGRTEISKPEERFVIEYSAAINGYGMSNKTFYFDPGFNMIVVTQPDVGYSKLFLATLYVREMTTNLYRDTDTLHVGIGKTMLPSESSNQGLSEYETDVSGWPGYYEAGRGALGKSNDAVGSLSLTSIISVDSHPDVSNTLIFGWAQTFQNDRKHETFLHKGVLESHLTLVQIEEAY